MAERVDDLNCNGFRILQDTEDFCFGMDAVLLANYTAKSVYGSVSPKLLSDIKILDLGCGNGIIPLLIAAKIDSRYIYGIEIRQSAVSLAQRSLSLNKVEDRVHLVEGDIREIKRHYKSGTMDIVTCNPPYLRSGLKNCSDGKRIARHEILMEFEDVAGAAAFTLKTRGKFFLVHRPDRLSEILSILIKYRLEPKRLRMVHSYLSEPAKIFLLECVKGGGRELSVEAPLVVYESKGKYTESLLDAYCSVPITSA